MTKESKAIAEEEIENYTSLIFSISN